MSYYLDRIRTTLATTGNLGIDARHVEAFMVLEHGTLDALSAQRFDAEVRTCADLVRQAGRTDSEALAVSYGL